MKKLIFIFVVFPSFAATCPTGMVAVEYDTFVPAVGGACPAGYVAHATETVCGAGDGACWLVTQLRALCGAGIVQLNVAGGVVIPLYADKSTSPALHIKYNDTICYADIQPGSATGTLNFKYNNALYHAVVE